MEIVELRMKSTPKIREVTEPHILSPYEAAYRGKTQIEARYLSIKNATLTNMTFDEFETKFRERASFEFRITHPGTRGPELFHGFPSKFNLNSAGLNIEVHLTEK